MKKSWPVFPGVLAVMLIGSVPAYAQKVIYELQVQDVYKDLISGLQAIPVGATAMQDPPGRGCDWSDAHGTIRSHYADGVLEFTETEYFSSILCIPTAPGQSMKGLISQSTLWFNSKIVDRGEAGSCLVSPIRPTCNQASSPGRDYCAGQLNCAGSYWIGHLATMELPDGWVWQTPVPEVCNLLSPSMLECSVVSDTVQITPTIPAGDAGNWTP